MSAPTTPAEMADWLEEHGGPPSAAHPNAESLSDDWAYIVQWLRCQPTDAQKIEALIKAGCAGNIGADAVDEIRVQDTRRYAEYETTQYLAYLSAREARNAMRLLGIPTGDETP